MTNVYQLLTTAAAATGESGDIWGSLLSYAPIVIVIIAFYFVLIRPQQKKDKEEYQKAYISVYQILYEGTTIAINNAMYSGDTRKNVMLRNVAGRIVIQQTKEKMG